MRFSDVRRLFPITKKYLYLDAASLAPYCEPVIKALRDFEEERRDGASLRFDDWLERLEKCRSLLAKLMKARGDEVALVKNTSEGVNLAALLVDWKKGDNVVVSDVDFPANVYPFLNLKKKGVTARFLRGNRALTPEGIASAIDEGTRLVSLSHVMYRDGYRLDIEGIGNACEEAGVLFHVDATQSLGALRLEVKKAKIDFLSVAGYKWLLSPLGSGSFYIAAKHLESDAMPLMGWKSVKEPLAFDATSYEIADSAARFELGNQDVAAFLGMEAALRLLMRIGGERVERRVLGLSSMILRGLKELGLEVLSDFPDENRSGIASMKTVFSSKDLHKKRIVATVREYTRFSPHLYNDEEDVYDLMNALAELKKRSP